MVKVGDAPLENKFSQAGGYVRGHDRNDSARIEERAAFALRYASPADDDRLSAMKIQVYGEKMHGKRLYHTLPKPCQWILHRSGITPVRQEFVLAFFGRLTIVRELFSVITQPD
jgi:hypothetical protein